MSRTDTLLKEAAEPLKEALREIDTNIEKVEIDLKELREDRNKLVIVLRRIAPEAVSADKPKAERKPYERPSDEMLRKFTEFLQLHAEELNGNGGFHVTGLVRDWHISDIGNPSTITRAVKALRDDGVLVLDHTGQGGSRYFKVVS